MGVGALAGISIGTSRREKLLHTGLRVLPTVALRLLQWLWWWWVAA
jgi:hypothetical protein